MLYSAAVDPLWIQAHQDTEPSSRGFIRKYPACVCLACACVYVYVCVFVWDWSGQEREIFIILFSVLCTLSSHTPNLQPVDFGVTGQRAICIRTFITSDFMTVSTTTLHYTTLHTTLTNHYTALYHTILHYAYYTRRHDTTRHDTALHCTRLHCTALLQLVLQTATATSATATRNSPDRTRVIRHWHHSHSSLGILMFITVSFRVEILILLSLCRSLSIQ